MASGSAHSITFEVVFHADEDRGKLPRWYFEMESSWLLRDGIWLSDPNNNRTWVGVEKIGNQPYISTEMGGVGQLRLFYDIDGFMVVKFEHIDHSECKIRIYGADTSEAKYPKHETDSDGDIIFEDDVRFSANWVAGWTVRMSASKAKQVLHIPASFVESVLRRKQQRIKLIAEDGSETMCYLKWQERNLNECGIGIGWYQFARKFNLGQGDVLHFKSKGDNKKLYSFIKCWR